MAKNNTVKSSAPAKSKLPELPPSVDVNPYQINSTVHAVFDACRKPAGISLANLRALAASSSVGMFPVTKHVRGLDGVQIGKLGYVWGLSINNGPAHFGPNPDLGTDANAIVRIVGIRPLSDVERLRAYNNGFRNGSQRVADITDYGMDGKRVKPAVLPASDAPKPADLKPATVKPDAKTKTATSRK